MKVTIHALERIQERTRLSLTAVTTLLAEKKFVWLGLSNNAAFLLFYDYITRKCKIALVGDKMNLLLSVWEEDFRLPKFLLPVTKERIYEARMRYRGLWKGDIPCMAQFLVREQKKVVYTHPLGLIFKACSSNSVVISHFFKEIKPIILLVDKHADSPLKEVDYLIQLQSPATNDIILAIPFKHKEFLQRGEYTKDRF